MGMRLESREIIARVLTKPEVFPIDADLEEIARKLLTVRLKAKDLNIDQLKLINEAIGQENFKAIADGISDAEAKTIIGKVDKENREAKTAGGAAQRVLLVELATGISEPKTKIIKERAPKATPRQSGAKRALSGSAMKVARPPRKKA